MDRVTADKVIAGNLSAVGKLPVAGKLLVAGRLPVAGKLPAEMEVGSCLRPAETGVGSRHFVEMMGGVVDTVADCHRAAYLGRVNNHYTVVYCLYPGWGIDFVE